MKVYTQEQVNKKYKDKYVEIMSSFDWDKRETLYEVCKVSRTSRENMTLGQDVGTELEYTR